MISFALAWVIVTYIKGNNNRELDTQLVGAFFITGCIDALMVIITVALLWG